MRTKTLFRFSRIGPARMELSASTDKGACNDDDPQFPCPPPRPSPRKEGERENSPALAGRRSRRDVSVRRRRSFRRHRRRGGAIRKGEHQPGVGGADRVFAPHRREGRRARPRVSKEPRAFRPDRGPHGGQGDRGKALPDVEALPRRERSHHTRRKGSLGISSKAGSFRSRQQARTENRSGLRPRGQGTVTIVPARGRASGPGLSPPLGLSSIELVVGLAVAGALLAATATGAFQLQSALAVRSAAAELSAAFLRARAYALTKGIAVALKFRKDGGRWEWALYRDGNRSEEHTSELQSQSNLVCRLLL